MRKQLTKEYRHKFLAGLIRWEIDIDIAIDDEITLYKKQFDVDFRADIKRVSNIIDFRGYLSGLTNLEEYFLGVKAL